jgi:hypothetical protein
MIKKTFKFTILAGFLYLLINVSTCLFAMPAFPEGFSVTQPDGNVIVVYLRGDEWASRKETVNGYTISQNSDDDYWYYISGYIDETPVLTDTKAHQDPPGWIEKHIKIEKEVVSEYQSLRFKQMVSPQRATTAGTGKILMILVEFTGLAGTYGEATWASILSDEIISITIP